MVIWYFGFCGRTQNTKFSFSTELLDGNLLDLCKCFSRENLVFMFSWLRQADCRGQSLLQERLLGKNSLKKRSVKTSFFEEEHLKEELAPSKGFGHILQVALPLAICVVVSGCEEELL